MAKICIQLPQKRGTFAVRADKAGWWKGLISTLTVPQLLTPIFAIRVNGKESTGTLYRKGNHL